MAQSEGYRGPLVYFTPEELRYIRHMARHDTMVFNSEVEKSIVKKIDVARNTDQKFREPMK